MLQKRNAYVTPVQKSRLIDYVTSNVGVLFGREPYQVDKPTKDELCTLIAVELNGIGAVKDVAGWKRSYASLKSSANRKLKNCASEAVKETKINSTRQLIPSNILRTLNSNSTAVQYQSRSDQGENPVFGTSDIKSAGIYSTLQQREKLINLISKNYDALFGKLSNSSNGDLIKKKVWKLIADELNLMGPKKDVKGWMRCFTGLKGSANEKLTAIRQNTNRKNNGKDVEMLDTIQSEMIKMHHPGTLDGCQTINELGFGEHTIPSNTSEFENSTLGEDADSIEKIDISDQELTVSKFNNLDQQ